MRIGILTFGTSALPDGVVELLRGDDIDVIPAEVPVTSLETARNEAERLSRADCDTLIYAVGEDTDPAQVAASALFAAVPLLLVGSSEPPLADAAGSLAELGIPFDRTLCPEPAALAIHLKDWTGENSRKERDRGIALVRDLYGKRVAFPAGTSLDTSHWMQQFGILPVSPDVPSDLNWQEPRPLEGLLVYLLHTLAETTPEVLPLGSPPTADAHPDWTTALAYYRYGRPFFVLLPPMVSDASSYSEYEWALLSSRVYSVPGNHRGALRAAAHALGIEVITLK
ncbi:MAG: hypothetical protein OHK0029_20870 [Armatimonadaceae bacterium]